MLSLLARDGDAAGEALGGGAALRAAVHLARIVEGEGDALVGRVLELVGVFDQGVEHLVGGVGEDRGQVHSLGAAGCQGPDGHLAGSRRCFTVLQLVPHVGDVFAEVVGLQPQCAVRLLLRHQQAAGRGVDAERGRAVHVQLVLPGRVRALRAASRRGR